MDFDEYACVYRTPPSDALKIVFPCPPPSKTSTTACTTGQLYYEWEGQTLTEAQVFWAEDRWDSVTAQEGAAYRYKQELHEALRHLLTTNDLPRGYSYLFRLPSGFPPCLMAVYERKEPDLIHSIHPQRYSVWPCFRDERIEFPRVTRLLRPRDMQRKTTTITGLDQETGAWWVISSPWHSTRMDYQLLCLRKASGIHNYVQTYLDLFPKHKRRYGAVCNRMESWVDRVYELYRDVFIFRRRSKKELPKSYAHHVLHLHYHVYLPTKTRITRKRVAEELMSYDPQEWVHFLEDGLL